jgi:hypothetical protein
VIELPQKPVEDVAQRRSVPVAVRSAPVVMVLERARSRSGGEGFRLCTTEFRAYGWSKGIANSAMPPQDLAVNSSSIFGERGKHPFHAAAIHI